MKEIKLTQGKVAVVEDEDYEELNRFKWYAFKCKKTFYAARSRRNEGNRRCVFMHQVILEPRVGFDTDHIDSNGLNNRRSNLRYATRSQNRFNSSKQEGTISTYKGVYPLPPNRVNKWRSRIMIDGCQKNLGCFAMEKQAALAYDMAANIYFREFAKTNF